MNDLINNWLNKNATRVNKQEIILKMVITFRINFEDAEQIYKKWRKDYIKGMN